MTEYISHTPVLLNPSLEFLITDPSGIYIDATLGGGGHSKAILDQLDDDGTLFGVDQDAEARAGPKVVGRGDTKVEATEEKAGVGAKGPVNG